MSGPDPAVSSPAGCPRRARRGGLAQPCHPALPERRGPARPGLFCVSRPAKPPVRKGSSVLISFQKAGKLLLETWVQRNTAVSFCPKVKPIKAPPKSYLRVKIYKSLVQIPLGNSCKIKRAP